MKKTIHKFCVALALATGLSTVSCTDDFSEINSAGTPTRDQAKGDFYTVGIYLQSMQTSVILVSPINAYQFNENLAAQPYARYLTIAHDHWSGQTFGTFNASINWLNSLFNDQMTHTYSSWLELKRQVEEMDMKDSYLWAWAELLRVAAVHRTTDVYGPLPYSQIKDNTAGSLLVAYDSQEDVYKGLFEDLNKSIATLSNFVAGGNTETALKVYDMVYGGDFNKWLKFANSLKLRMAMRIAYVNPTLAEQYAMEAIASGKLMESNADNAQIALESNPLYTMWGAYGDTRAAAEIICYMRGYMDNRLDKYFVPVAANAAFNAGKFAGQRLGNGNTDAKWGQDYFSVPRVAQKDPIVWMTAAEVAFLKAEAAAYWKWLPEADAEAYYNEGIRLSFEQWGASGADAYMADATSTPAAYNDDASNVAAAPSSITIKWDEAADTETKLERIITQKWIALYPVGVEGWAEQRRTGFPRVFKIPVNRSTESNLSTRGASRIPFAPSEAQNNSANYRDAVNRYLGGKDIYGTRLWWDAKPNKIGW